MMLPSASFTPLTSDIKNKGALKTRAIAKATSSALMLYTLPFSSMPIEAIKGVILFSKSREMYLPFAGSADATLPNFLSKADKVTLSPSVAINPKAFSPHALASACR